MAQVTTKLNVGDKVVTLDKTTQKIKDVTVGGLMVTVKADETSVVVYPLKDDGTVDWFTTYEESRCFANAQEMIDYIQN